MISVEYTSGSLNLRIDGDDYDLQSAAAYKQLSVDDIVNLPVNILDIKSGNIQYKVKDVYTSTRTVNDKNGQLITYKALCITFKPIPTNSL